MSGKIFVVSAPSGAGKSSLVTAVIKHLGSAASLRHVATYTTRKPRPNEQQGYDYNFIDSMEFKQRVQDGFFLEWSDAYTAYYGSPQSVVQDMHKGKSSILILDRAGAWAVKEQVPGALLIRIVVPFKELKKRLVVRATETEQEINQRLKRSLIEIELERQEPLYHYTILNDNFDNALRHLLTIVCSALVLPTGFKSAFKGINSVIPDCSKRGTERG